MQTRPAAPTDAGASPRPADAAARDLIASWIARGLHARYDAVRLEPLPKEILELLG